MHRIKITVTASVLATSVAVGGLKPEVTDFWDTTNYQNPVVNEKTSTPSAQEMFSSWLFNEGVSTPLWFFTSFPPNPFILFLR